MQHSISESLIYSEEELSSLDPTRIPYHIAIIPDGNRRWAKLHHEKFIEGHRKGSEMILEIFKAASEIGVKALTIYAFSTENWLRPKEEVNALMVLLKQFLMEQRHPMIEHDIRLQSIGDLETLPAIVTKDPYLLQQVKEVQTELQLSKQATAHCQKIDCILAINYGGRSELCRAFEKMAGDLLLNKIRKEEVSETLIQQYIDTAAWPDPDLFIRTSGEYRVSNFLLWQLAYTEFYLSPVLWPDFTPAHFLEAVRCYQQRQRRLGGAKWD